MSTGTNTETRKYLYHCKKEENAPDLHGASDQLLLPDHHFKVANDGFQLVFKCQLWINLKRISAINWTLEYEKENQLHNAMWRCFKQCFKFSNREAMTEYGISVWWPHCSLKQNNVHNSLWPRKYKKLLPGIQKSKSALINVHQPSALKKRSTFTFHFHFLLQFYLVHQLFAFK